MNAPQRRQRYRSFLLRLWREQDEHGFVCRFSLEDPHSGERRGFATWAQLDTFIKEVIAELQQATHGSAHGRAIDGDKDSP